MNLTIASIIAAIILGLIGYGWYEHGRASNIQAKYDTFIAKSQTLAAQQLVENAQKEKAYAEQVKSAESARDAALNKLRDERTHSSRVSVTPQGPERLCFSRSQFDAALQSFLGTVENLIAEGDTALIDNQTLLKAWPN